jgi:transglutaminase superfamily protein
MLRSMLGALLLFIASVATAEDGPPIDIRLHLAVLHPEVFGHARFKAWERGGQKLTAWREEEISADRKQVVVIQGAGSKYAFDLLAFQVQLDHKPTVVDVRPFPANIVKLSYRKAAKLVHDKVNVEVTGGLPHIDFNAPVPLGWELRFGEGGTGTVKVRGAYIAPPELPVPEEPHPHDCTSGDGDALSQNQLHHPNDPAFHLKALVLVNGISDPKQRAEALCDYVFSKYRYGAAQDADAYTDSDELTRSRGWGACDEKAVILITFLRAVGIPSRLKLLRWFRTGETGTSNEYSHASVEYVVDNVVHYLDPTFDLKDEPEHYRTLTVDGSRVTTVKIVDADWPDDSRSTDPVGTSGLPDTNSQDGRLNPWKDFCYRPSTGGEERPRYSFD